MDLAEWLHAAGAEVRGQRRSTPAILRRGGPSAQIPTIPVHHCSFETLAMLFRNFILLLVSFSELKYLPSFL